MIFSRYFLVTELCLYKSETHVANYCIFKLKETNVHVC